MRPSSTTRRALRQDDRHRQPAAGRVVERQRAAHRVDEALRDRQARARRRRRSAGRRVAGTAARPCSRSSAAMPCPRSTTRMWTSSPTRRASIRTGWSSGLNRIALADDVGEAAFEQRRVARRPAARSTGCRRRPRSLGSVRRCAARRRRSSATGRPDVDRQRADLQPAGVEQVADEAVEAVGLLLDREQRLGDLSGVHATVGSRRPETIALIDASGVRRSCDTARSSAVRTASMSASAAASAASAASAWLSIATASWSASTRRRRSSSGDSVPPTDVERPGRQSERHGWVPRQCAPSARRRASPASRRDRVGSATRRERTPARPNVERICSTSAGPGPGRRRGWSSTRERLGLEAGAARLERALRGAVSTSEPTVTATATNTTSAMRFSASADRQRVVRRDEEPVDEQRGEHGGHDRRRAGHRSRRSPARRRARASSSVDRSIVSRNGTVTATKSGRPTITSSHADGACAGATAMASPSRRAGSRLARRRFGR